MALFIGHTWWAGRRGFSFRSGRKIRLRRIRRRSRRSLTLAHDCFRIAGRQLRIHRFHPTHQVGLGLMRGRHSDPKCLARAIIGP
jgi:hypothetical protein